MNGKLMLSLLIVLLFSGLALAQSSNAMLDPLRDLTATATSFDSITTHIVLIATAIVTLISFLGYRKVHSKRLLLISFAFLLFTTKSFLKVLDIYVSPGLFFADAAQNVFDLLFLAALFVGLFYRGQVRFNKA
jgi:hypothetical protein